MCVPANSYYEYNCFVGILPNTLWVAMLRKEFILEENERKMREAVALLRQHITALPWVYSAADKGLAVTEQIGRNC